MDYVFFLLLTATLFIRPAELVPAVQGWPIYEWLIIASLVVSAPRIARCLRPRDLRANPITVCVLGLFVSVPLSFLTQFSLWHMRWSLTDFGKVVLFYLLVTAVVDSHERLRRLLFALLLFVSVLAGLSLLHYFDIWRLPALQASMQQRVVDHATGRNFELDRLQSTGIFSDPNDFAMILVVGIIFNLHFLGEQRGILRRGPLLAVMLLLGYALFLTRSRGGMLALLGGLGTLAYARWGWKKAALGVAAAMPMVLVVFSMREDAMTSGTGQSRVQLWAEGLAMFKQSPLWGIGYGQYYEELGHVAHNSFLHCFTELGLFGGAFFWGVLFSGRVAVRSPQKRRPGGLARSPTDPGDGLGVHRRLCAVLLVFDAVVHCADLPDFGDRRGLHPHGSRRTRRRRPAAPAVSRESALQPSNRRGGDCFHGGHVCVCSPHCPVVLGGLA